MAVPAKDDVAIGQRVPLIDGRAKVTGHLKYIADLKLPGMLYAHLIGSDYAHANILSVEKDAALNVAGVIAVLTAKDLPDIIPSSRGRLLLARERVIFYGQPVALVIANSEYAAADGAEKVIINYEPLAVVITPEQAMADDAAIVWPYGVPGEGNTDAGAHGADTTANSQNNLASHSNIVNERNYQQGDVELGFEQADIIVEHRFSTPIVHQSYLEPQGVIAQPDLITGGMTIWTSTQAPFDLRQEIADLLNVVESDVRVVPTPVGGGFGGKFGLYEPLIALAAQRLKRPIQLALFRMNEMAATQPAPHMQIQARMGADKEGNLTALDAHIILDSGCYPSWITGFSAFAMGTQYRIPHYNLSATNVLTFKPSVAAYRAPTAPTIVFVLDTLIDEIAERLDMDSVELRLKNCIQAGDLLPNGETMPSIGMRETLQMLQQHPLWQNRDESRKQGRGVGIAVGGWMGGVEPGAAVCKLNRDGMVHIHLGSVDLTGIGTTFSLVAAEAFGVEPEQIRVIFSDTDTAPYSGSTAGSKITYSMTSAIVQAAKAARMQTLEIAAEEFEASVQDLEIVDGKVQVKGVPSQQISLSDIAKKTMQFSGKYAPIFAHGRAAMRRAAPGFNAQLIEIEVDRETGMVHILNHVAVQDVGKALNPMAIEGQMMGGAVQGLGWALYEGMTYDNQSGQLLSGTWLDYAVPSAEQAGQSFETIIVEVPSDEGHFGIRGVGEPPVIPTAAAVANAIAHATGIRITSLPMSPTRIFTALNQSSTR